MLVNMLRQYFKVIATALIGLAFGFASFFLFMNFYHYQEVRRQAYIDYENNNLIKEYEDTVSKIEANIDSFKSSSYSGRLSYMDASVMKNRLSACTNSLKNDTYNNIRKNQYINIKDVYNLAKSFEDDVLNSCIVSQLYSLVTDQSNINDSYFTNNQLLLKSYMDDLLTDGEYLMSDLENNSSYYFNTDIISLTVKNNTRDGFYEVMNNYNKAAKFVYVISEWYKNSVTGIESGVDY